MNHNSESLAIGTNGPQVYSLISGSPLAVLYSPLVVISQSFCFLEIPEKRNACY